MFAIDITSDQDLLRQTSARFIADTCPLAKVRKLAESAAHIGADYRRQAAELGWFAMLVAEEHGGGSISANALTDAAIIASTRGAFLQPEPFVGTNVVALALSAAGNADQRTAILPRLVSGEASAAWAAAGPGGVWDAGSGVDSVAARGGYILRGTKIFVQSADLVDWLLVTTTSGNGTTQFLVDAGTAGMTVRRLAGLDLTRTFCEVTFDDVELPPSSLVGREGEADAAAEYQLRVACVLTIAEAVGAMEQDFESALEYAKTRIAFGRPIGSFQAVKHLLADTSLLLEMSKAMTAAAAQAVGSDSADAGMMASSAKAFVSDAAGDLAQNCFQVFGGIGFTWEHDQHLYLRRLAVDAALYGDASWHRERLCRMSGL